MRDETAHGTSFSRPAGFHDARPAVARRHAWVRHRASEVFARYGYDPVEVPTVEYLGLYDRGRIGDGLFHGLLTARLPDPALFPARLADKTLPEAVHEVALRPELTAPVARLALEWLGSGSPPELPLRLCAHGSVYRDLGTRALQQRQFHQVGAERFGGDREEGDLEALLLATDVAAAVGVPTPRLHVGHAGLLQALLDAVEVPRAACGAVSIGLERAVRLRRKARDPDPAWSVYVRARLPELQRLASSAERQRFPGLVDATVSLSDLRAQLPAAHAAWLTRAWGALGVSAEQSARLLAAADLNAAPEATLSALRALLPGPAGQRALDELSGVLDAFTSLRSLPVLVSPTANRGVAFYCGLSFELHTDATGAALTDVGGGGRVDGLVQWLSARMADTRAVRGEPPAPVPAGLTAAGLAFGVERLAAVAPEPPTPVRVGVTGPRAAAVADRLRGAGICVAVRPGPSAGLWVHAGPTSHLHRGPQRLASDLTDRALAERISALDPVSP